MLDQYLELPKEKLSRNDVRLAIEALLLLFIVWRLGHIRKSIGALIDRFDGRQHRQNADDSALLPALVRPLRSCLLLVRDATQR